VRRTQERIKQKKKERKKRYISKRLSDALYSEFVSFSLPKNKYIKIDIQNLLIKFLMENRTRFAMFVA
jgi:hypothetical protein